jgi:hypothetical protein
VLVEVNVQNPNPAISPSDAAAAFPLTLLACLPAAQLALQELLQDACGCVCFCIRVSGLMADMITFVQRVRVVRGKDG